MRHVSLLPLVPALALASSLLFAAPSSLASDTSGPFTNRTQVGVLQEVSPELMRSFLHLQEQVHETQMAVERSRMQAEAAAARNAEALNARLKLIEDAMDRSSRENAAAIVESNRQIKESNNTILLVGGLLAFCILAALGIMGWMQWKAVTQIASLPHAGFPTLLTQGYPPFGAGGQQAQLASTQLMSVLGRLEHRIAEMEGTSHSTRPLKVVPVSDPAAEESVERRAGERKAETETPLADVIREGEELLAGEDAEKAVDYFDSLLVKHPGNPELLLRKGTALERLQRDQEAIECYDLAIKADPDLTMAYLHKGGLFNRMERFSEAMECYEQALRVQEHRRSA
jgi:tetratricopeptide (TPR) repeat protein